MQFQMCPWDPPLLSLCVGFIVLFHHPPALMYHDITYLLYFMFVTFSGEICFRYRKYRDGKIDAIMQKILSNKVCRKER
jgi:hypothetical protein